MDTTKLHSRTIPLALGALGVVYGDIGTSPLYTLKECFHGPHAIPLTHDNLLGVLSLVFWALTVEVAFKYLGFILKADNRGEGGIFALLALLPRDGRRFGWMVVAALLGAALLYGDGVITPAISVLSAVEGLEVATQAARPLVVPITVLVLLVLFSQQHRGTGHIGRAFGPVMLVWFAALAALGVRGLVHNPAVLAAVNPLYAVRFFAENGLHGALVLGSVVLCITGAEALYADLGHFGRRPIRLSWFSLVFPALLLNYFGQGAMLLEHPERAANPFYGLVPGPLLYPMVGLATVATVIASQALISGVFSVTRQAVQLGFLPRTRVIHTSGETVGQIFVPMVNRLLAVACIALVIAFGSSSRLAAAYGIAVTANMVLTSLIFYAVTRQTWGWKPARALPLVALFLVFDLAFFSSSLLKVADGGWLPVVIAAGLLSVMLTWRDGRVMLARQMAARTIPLRMFIEDLGRRKPSRAPGTSVFLSSSPQGTPVALLHHFKHTQLVHEQVIVLSVLGSDRPTLPDEQRVEIEPLGEGFFRVRAEFGFMESPNVPEVLQLAQQKGLETSPGTTSYFLGKETMLTTGREKMMGWRKALFAYLSRNAEPANAFFALPPGRVIELGMQIEI